MENQLNISEIFFGIQGEGRYCGVPALFIRLSGCTRACSWCDTKYHKEGKEMSFEELNGYIDKYLPETIVWTGGEPLLQFKELENFLLQRGNFDSRHHIETNGDLIGKTVGINNLGVFSYICCSPKDAQTAENAFKILSSKPHYHMKWDTKVVTDMFTVGLDMLKYATMLMPQTSGHLQKDAEVRKKVWEYCTEHRLRYSPRLHVEVFGSGKRGV